MNKINITKRNKCRICGSENLKKWITLEDMPLTDNIKYEELDSEFLDNIDIHVCMECFTSQTLTDISYNEYYNDYNYSVNQSQTANKFMDRLCNKLCEEYKFKNGCTILEIGSSDGSQLKYFKDKGAEVFGIEPSKELCDISKAKGVPVYHGLFDENIINKIPIDFTKVDLVILEYTFDHLPEPMSVLKNIKTILNKEGLVVIEVHDLEKILKRKEYCLFEHEHTIYLSKETIKYILAREGFEVIDFNLLEESEKRANSLLVVAKLKCEKEELAIWNKHSIHNFSIYENFKIELNLSMKKLNQFINDNINSGKRIAGFGAGGRGVMTLAAINCGNKISFICDNNTMMKGLYTPKTHIKIVDPVYLKEDPVDVLIVFSFGYIEEIKKQIKAITNKKIKVVNLLDILKI
ncbi:MULTISPECIES: class I SAM-dependent methyltransferase [Clostridium]|nr:class I SAM-dependent methyltransferase [Clostridium sporogenes]AJD30250.1 methyltransferase domain protein [Clostridium botulinum Prevot_594]